MRMMVRGAMIAGLMTLGACGSKTPAENKADAVEANAAQ
jgi:predicted small lipoprotein YifL